MEGFFLSQEWSDRRGTGSQGEVGFRTRKCPPRIEELEAFEDDLLKMIKDLWLRNTSNALQKQLRQDIERIYGSKDVIVPADKTRNLYAVSKTQYEKLLRENITEAYKLASACTYDDINKEAKGIAQRLEIAERKNCMATNEAFITLKDHKDDFSNALPWRLINPAKSEIGRILKTTLDRILTAVNQKVATEYAEEHCSCNRLVFKPQTEAAVYVFFSASTLWTSILLSLSSCSTRPWILPHSMSHLPAGQGSNPSCQTVHAFWAGHGIVRRNHGMR